MTRFTLSCLFVLSIATFAHGAEGMVSVESAHDVLQTADRLERVLGQKGMTVFARIKHSEAARTVGITLRDTELLIFGNPAAGSSLMDCAQTVGIDLPQKALVWKDGTGKVWISYNNPRYLEMRHGITGCEDAIRRIENALDGIARSAASQEAPVSPPSGFQVH